MFELLTAPSESFAQRGPVGPGYGVTAPVPSSSTPDVVPSAATSKSSSIESGVNPAVPLDPKSPTRSSSGIDVVIEGAAKIAACGVKRPLALSIVAVVAAPR
jgi:hypothetical protein